MNKYIYLEHGAFRAILALAVIMFINTPHQVLEVITGCIGAGFIGIALISSISADKKVKHCELTPTELR